MSEAEKAREVAERVYAALCADPAVWATHGSPPDTKANRIIAAYAAALLQLRRDTTEECAKHLQDKFDGADALAKFAVLCRYVPSIRGKPHAEPGGVTESHMAAMTRQAACMFSLRAR